MTIDSIEAALLGRYGVRAGPSTRRYIAGQLAAGTASFAILAGDARTGRPVCQLIVPAELATAAAPAGVAR